ncbi:hypothetical protein BT93_C0536 [Corymbia citriodora subsp. variegata]|nr:hypothetical protein BT93_C0536 [Corymbia citriodora subsp. variegata]
MATRYPGLCFQPTDRELFSGYLMRRLNQEPTPDLDVIRDCDVYGGDPWEIFDNDKDEKFYVFTVLKKKNKSRVDRTAGSGTWKGEQSYKIRDLQGNVVGYKKLFTFKPKAGSGTEADKAENGHWIMYEFSKHPHNETECVLCVISNKYAEEESKKACRNLHGRVQLGEENRRARKARPLPDDHTYAAGVPSPASPPSTAATAQAQPSTSPAFSRDEVAIPLNDICYATGPPAFHGERNADSNIQEYTRPTASPAFGSMNGGPFSMTSTAAPGVDPEWVDRLKNMEISPTVERLFFKVLQQRAQALDPRKNLVESHPGGVPANLSD